MSNFTNRFKLKKFVEEFRKGDLQVSENYLKNVLSAKVAENLFKQKKEFIKKLNEQEQQKNFRPIWKIAEKIKRDWKKPYFGAIPYLEAMSELNSISDKYYDEDAKSIIRYFLANSSSWKGETARRIKEELRQMVSSVEEKLNLDEGCSCKHKKFNEKEENEEYEEPEEPVSEKEDSLIGLMRSTMNKMKNESEEMPKTPNVVSKNKSSKKKPEVLIDQDENLQHDTLLADTDDVETLSDAVVKWIRTIGAAPVRAENSPVEGSVRYRGVTWKMKYNGKYPKGIVFILTNLRSNKSVEIVAKTLNDLKQKVLNEITGRR